MQHMKGIDTILVKTMIGSYTLIALAGNVATYILPAIQHPACAAALNVLTNTRLQPGNRHKHDAHITSHDATPPRVTPCACAARRTDARARSNPATTCPAAFCPAETCPAERCPGNSYPNAVCNMVCVPRRYSTRPHAHELGNPCRQVHSPKYVSDSDRSVKQNGQHWQLLQWQAALTMAATAAGCDTDAVASMLETLLAF